MSIYPKTDDIACGSCAHFCRHYVRSGSRYIPLTFGHCICLRTKDRRDGNTCPAWTPRNQK